MFSSVITAEYSFAQPDASYLLTVIRYHLSEGQIAHRIPSEALVTLDFKFIFNCVMEERSPLRGLYSSLRMLCCGLRCVHLSRLSHPQPAPRILCDHTSHHNSPHTQTTHTQPRYSILDCMVRSHSIHRGSFVSKLAVSFASRFTKLRKFKGQ